MMTAGVARNRDVARGLKKRLGEKLFTADAPDLRGAFGAALYAAGGKLTRHSKRSPRTAVYGGSFVKLIFWHFVELITYCSAMNFSEAVRELQRAGVKIW